MTTTSSQKTTDTKPNQRKMQLQLDQAMLLTPEQHRGCFSLPSCSDLPSRTAKSIRKRKSALAPQPCTSCTRLSICYTKFIQFCYLASSLSVKGLRTTCKGGGCTGKAGFQHQNPMGCLLVLMPQNQIFPDSVADVGCTGTSCLSKTSIMIQSIKGCGLPLPASFLSGPCLISSCSVSPELN